MLPAALVPCRGWGRVRVSLHPSGLQTLLKTLTMGQLFLSACACSPTCQACLRMIPDVPAPVCPSPSGSPPSSLLPLLLSAFLFCDALCLSCHSPCDRAAAPPWLARSFLQQVSIEHPLCARPWVGAEGSGARKPAGQQPWTRTDCLEGQMDRADAERPEVPGAYGWGPKLGQRVREAPLMRS